MPAKSIGGLRVHVRGIVQGVGFRPFVYSLAVQNQLTGWVRNTSSGVEIEINGDPQALNAFVDSLKTQPPALAKIDAVEVEKINPNSYASFEILSSQPVPGQFIPIPPDTAICPDCRAELFDPTNRRYRYPFINCTNCGPRFTIIRDTPYDRPKTTMAEFEMCPTCRHEYEDPLDRRFHAQPTACPVCGPQVWFETKGNRLAEREDAIQLARKWLSQGKILAVKGLGGFLLACDASNKKAVEELRQRKKRSDKPFALMCFDIQTLRRHCSVSAEEERLLTSSQQPIVLLNRLPESSVTQAAAPNQNTLGVMLPYTPLHLLLIEPEEGFPEMLVMTSGNISEEPIAYRDQDALRRLSPLADGFLMHDRPIHTRTDDSVTRVFQGSPILLRRARGFAPDPVRLSWEVPQVFAAGAELKNTFCLTRGNYAFLSHHIGDLENLETLQSFEEGIRHYENLFRVKPECIACDLHPNYLATRYAHNRAERENLPLIQVQHHHAHLAACLADNGWNQAEPVIGLSFDGTGYGTDGAIWGGEVLVGGYQSYQRTHHLTYVPLPGGDLAVRKPARMALAHLWKAGLEWDPALPSVQSLCYEERTALRGQLDHHINTPLTSSMGRLFDAAAALIGIRQEVTYEGQAAIEMESAADPQEVGIYELYISDSLIDPLPLWENLIHDLLNGVSRPILSARFHNSIAFVSAQVCRSLRSQLGVNTVALSGGVWQNMFLLERTISHLRQAGFKVLLHQQTPANDGCIALGQAAVAAAYFDKEN